MLNETEIRELVAAHGATVNEGRPIRQLIDDGELPRLGLVDDGPRIKIPLDVAAQDLERVRDGDEELGAEVERRAER